MNNVDNQMLWRQFGAAIDMLDAALLDCPDELREENLWEGQVEPPGTFGFSAFWYVGYPALFWLDLYLNGKEEGFSPPEPFDLAETHAGEAPPRAYTRAELLNYLQYCRHKRQQTIGAMSAETAQRMCRFPWDELPSAELPLYNMRHVQEHGAQLHMFLGQHAAKSSRWISRA